LESGGVGEWVGVSRFFFFLKLEAFDWCMIQKDEKLAVFWDFLTFHYLSNKKKFIGKKNFYWLKKNWRKNFTGFFFQNIFLCIRSMHFTSTRNVHFADR
jgi:hypothetical protein